MVAGVRRRYTVPALAASRRVFAPCLLGFGWSDKPLVEYDGYDVWPRQLAAFIREVGAACKRTGVSGMCWRARWCGA
jgi:pimeloyl-ACP methyl ester carboxylesterase